MPVWQRIYEEINNPNFVILCAAEDIGGEAVAGPIFDAANPTYIQVVDPDHIISSAFNFVNVPSAAWVDETGRGYLVQGIWIDNDLTKFFSKLFLPEGKHTYPFYPFVCKYKTICQNLIDLGPEMRKKLLPYLHRALGLLRPVMPEIEGSLKEEDFSESNVTFRRLKRTVPPPWSEIWNSLRLEMYLNDRDMKEYHINYAAG